MKQIVCIEATRIATKDIDMEVSIESSLRPDDLVDELIRLLELGEVNEVARLLNIDYWLDDGVEFEDNIEFEDINVRVYEDVDEDGIVNDLTESARDTLPLFPSEEDEG